MIDLTLEVLLLEESLKDIKEEVTLLMENEKLHESRLFMLILLKNRIIHLLSEEVDELDTRLYELNDCRTNGVEKDLIYLLNLAWTVGLNETAIRNGIKKMKEDTIIPFIDI